MAMHALLDDGDEVLVPAPDYPLWTAVGPAGRRHGRALPLRRAGRLVPGPRRHRGQGHRPHQGHRRHQPQQPHRRGLPASEVLEGIARARPPARADRAAPTRSTTRSSTTTPSTLPLAALRRDVSASPSTGCPRPTGWPASAAGWMVVSGAQGARRQLHRGPRRAGQHAAVRQRAGPARDPGRARRPPVDQRPDSCPAGGCSSSATRLASCSTRSPGSAASSPRARCTPSRAWTRQVYQIKDDEQFVLDLLRREKILIVQGTGFNWPEPDHFRLRHAAARRGPRGRDHPDRRLPPGLHPAVAVAAAAADRRQQTANGRHRPRGQWRPSCFHGARGTARTLSGLSPGA